VIDICTPSFLHFEQTCEVLAAGKHVICEKPLAGSLKQVDELTHAEAQSGRRIMPIFQYRFGHGLQKLKFLADEGLTGRAYVTTVETAWRRREDYYRVPPAPDASGGWRGKWKTELGGTLVTHAIHAHDMLTYILGPVRNVFARTATRVHPIETEDCASVSLEMADGSLASLSVTVGSCEQISRHRFCFSNLTAESNTRPYSNSSDPWTFIGDTPQLTVQIEAALAHFVPQPEGFEGQFSQFYRALQSGTELPVTLSDARASVELLTAIYASARTAQAVNLPIGSEHPLYAGWVPLSHNP
jgi:predicted dehydrogenase